MNRGDVVLVRFPFTNFTSTKVRPAVVISNDDINGSRGDVIVAFISSKTQGRIKDTDYIIRDTDPSFSNTGLTQTSLFKMAKIVTLDRSMISNRLGEVSEEIKTDIDEKLRKALAL